MHVREKPPLRVKMDIQTPGGKHYRWAEDEPSPESVPSGLRWSDTMPGGFETMDCVLPRKPGIDYADLEQLSTIRVLGASGDVAGEFRLERAPRTSGDQVAISPGAVGWQAHLEDDKSAREIYVHRNFSEWQGVTSARKISVGSSYTHEEPVVGPGAGGIDALTTGVSGPWAAGPGVARSTATYYANGIPLGRLFGVWTKGPVLNAADPNWTWQGLLASDSTTLTPNDPSGNLRAAGPGSFSLDATTATRYVAVVDLFYAAVAAGADNVQHEIHWTALAVYGNHDLTYRSDPSGGASEPWGFYASDVVAHVVPKWAPQLNVTTESVQPSSFVIPHLAATEPTTAGEIVRQATRFGLQDWGVWDNKTFWWHERGAFSKRWRSRVALAQLDETGPQVDRLWESVIVSYQDVDGTTKTVGPPGSGANTESADLKDNDPDNPANLLGIVRRDVLQMGTSTAAGATEVGRRFLIEAKVLDRSGRARIVGHVEDDRGVLHPYWAPRAGDYIEFLDAADPSPRRIVKTDKDHSARTCGLDLDAPPEGLQALLERLGVVLVPLGLG